MFIAELFPVAKKWKQLMNRWMYKENEVYPHHEELLGHPKKKVLIHSEH